jgi:hypothetical protein
VTRTLYDFTYNDPSGYSYKGQVVSDDTLPEYLYKPGTTFKSPYINSDGQSGTYTIGTTGTPTQAPSGAVFMTSYTSADGTTYKAYHYDPASASYFDMSKGYDKQYGQGGDYPAWTTEGLGSEYAYINSGTTTNPQYHVYGGGGQASYGGPGSTSTPTTYDFQFLYPDGSYYDGKVVDDGTFRYYVDQQIHEGVGTYSIYNQESTPPPATELAGYSYTLLYSDANTKQYYAPSDLTPNTPYYQKPVGYLGLGSEHDYINTGGLYFQFDDTGNLEALHNGLRIAYENVPPPI